MRHFVNVRVILLYNSISGFYKVFVVKPKAYQRVGDGNSWFLQQWFGRSPKWNRVKAYFGYLPSSYGKSLILPVKPKIYYLPDFGILQ